MMSGGTEMIRLVDVRQGKLVVNCEGFLRLKGITGRVFAVGAVGPILTGKSSLLNSLIGRPIFPTGSTTMPKTKGIDAYIEQLKTSSTSPALWKVYLDIQGFDNSFNDTNEDLDLNLLLLACSVCQVVVYNSFGALDSRVFERLGRAAQGIGRGQGRTGIVLLQRDFTLKMVSKEDQVLDDQGYLECCMKNFKDKDTLSTISDVFKGLKCFTLTHPGEKNKFGKGIETIKSYINHRALESLLESNERQSELTDSVNFTYNLLQCLEILQSKGSLSDLSKLAQGQKQQNIKSWIALYKSSLLERVKKQLKQNMPMPEELLLFKFKNISKECLENLGTDGKEELNFIKQTIGEEKLEEITKRVLDGLMTQNGSKIREFIENKIDQFIQSRAERLETSQSLSRLESQIVENLINYYPFITESQTEYIQLLIYREIASILTQKVSTSKLKNTELTLCKQQKQKDFQSQLSAANRQLSELQEEVQVLKTQFEAVMEENGELKRREDEKNAMIREAERNVQEFQQVKQGHSENGELLLREIQDQLRQNLMYEKKTKAQQGKQSELDSESSKIILSEIGKVLQVLQNENQSTREQQKKHFQMITVLQKMNKSLRERIQQLMCGNSTTQIMERKFTECQQQLRQKQKAILSVANEKEIIIQRLRAQLRHQKEVVKTLQFQVELTRAKALDKGKTSEFMERLLEAKEKLVEQGRLELLENLTRYKEEMNSLKTQFRQRELQLSDTLSMFIAKNEQLTTKNTELSTKNSTLQSKLKKQHEEKLLQKQLEITKLNNSLTEFQKNLANATESYMQVANQMEQLLREKDERLYGLGMDLERAEERGRQIAGKCERFETECEELRDRLHRIQIEKQELQCKIKREQVLTDNRIRHLTSQIQKLKAQLKQKQSTFQLMLLQLRSQSIISNTSSNTGSKMRENSRQKYLKKIDQIEEIAIKELEEISNMRYSRGDGHGHLRAKVCPHTKSESKEMHDENDPKMEYGTDKKKITRPVIHEYSGSKNFASQHAYLNSSISNTFKTVAKKL